MDQENIVFTVNGNECVVGGEVTSDDTLLDYIRKTLELRGTKYMCREGGCGACVVSAVKSPGAPVTAVNSCLVSVTSCHNWEITTIEDVGNRLDGYHILQTTLAKYNGTQCGYCTQGWIMNMYSLLQEKKLTMTKIDIEKLMSSNICRCTGYRPILDAFKTFAIDADESKLTDIEDLNSVCSKNRRNCKKSCKKSESCFVNENLTQDDVIEIKLKDNKKWFRVNSIEDIFTILENNKGKLHMLIFGNTGKGAYPIFEYPDILVDISGIAELKKVYMDQNLVVGAGVTLNEAIKLLKDFSINDNFEYLKKISEHVFLIANTSVRNLATLGGNLMVKHQHNIFQSDIFLLLTTVGATITVVQPFGIPQDLKPEEFLKTDMSSSVIISVKLPPINEEDHMLETFKIMPRAQNSPAIVNAGFLYKLEKDQETIKSANIIFEGINPEFLHAEKTELFLIGKKIFKNETLQACLEILKDEINVYGFNKTVAKGKKKLALGLFYKGLLRLCPKYKLKDSFQSGSEKFEQTRPVSSGTEVYDTNPLVWPINKPTPKVEALIQCAGEAPYADDIPAMKDEVFANFVITTKLGDVESMDPSPALALDGVVAFFTIDDLPGLNSFTPSDFIFNIVNEPVLNKDTVICTHAVIGIIVAETEQLAERAAKLVVVKYKNIRKPTLTIEQAKGDLGRILPIFLLPAVNRGLDVDKVIKGQTKMHGQYHFTMEKQTCVTKPNADGIFMYPSSQWIESAQIAVGDALNLKQNKIDVSCRRVGGGFGAKISRSNQIAVCCALVTLKLNRPCRMVLPLVTNMKAIGKRTPSRSEYEVAVNSSGEIQNLEYHLYEDQGCIVNELLIYNAMSCIKGSYDRSRWNIAVFDVITDTSSNSWCRAPGTLEMTAIVETIMERISYELSLDPIKVREINLPTYSEDDASRECFKSLKTDADYDKRRVEVTEFNEKNRWKKRGLRFSCVKWPVSMISNYTVSISVNHGDASVVITHGGIEIGQGINTKAIQVCAYVLNIPMDKIRVKATNNLTNPNTLCTGGSWTSDTVCYGIIKCCQILLDKLKPLRSSVGDSKWETLIDAAYQQGVSLFSTYTPTSNDQKSYNVFGAAIAEVEVDILTGEIQVRRVDIIEDVGQSLNPAIDVGQIEGAFIMGLGLWTCEELIYDEDSGELLTDRTWNYHVPQARDIPVDFRIYFKRKDFNTDGVLGSKATGEPATCLAVSVAFAIREAITSSRADSGKPTTDWFDIDGCYSPRNILMAAEVDTTEFLFD